MLSRPQSWRAFVLAVAFALLVALPVSAARREGSRAGFIVVLKDSVGSAGPVAAEHARRFGADVRYVYAHALKGYAAMLSEDQLGALASDARVDFIERDATVTAVATQTGATWGEPSGMRVDRWAKFAPRTRALTSSESAMPFTRRRPRPPRFPKAG